jgi:hypothetical protein
MLKAAAMCIRSFVLVFSLWALIPQFSSAQEPAAGGDPTVVGQLEHTGWGLTGSRGRHYVFGGLAIADYTDSAGERRIMALQHEDQISDERYLYYRELRTGHRWAFAKRVARDGQYGVYFQLAAADAASKPAWLPFHRARLEQAGAEQGRAISAPVLEHVISREQTCSR